MRRDKPWVLDLCCCAGGAGHGYVLGGGRVTPVDIVDRPSNPHGSVRYDAIKLLRSMIRSGEIMRYTLVHISPPCQAKHSLTVGSNGHRKSTHKDLIPGLRPLLAELTKLGIPYVMEQPVGVSGIRKDLMLCMDMFPQAEGPKVWRHRYFELGGWKVGQPAHPKHEGRVRGWRHGAYYEGDYVAVYGKGGGKATVPEAQRALDIPWTDSWDELVEAIPPAYTQWIMEQFLRQVPFTCVRCRKWIEREEFGRWGGACLECLDLPR
jgi:hypothetical protein